MKQKTHEKLLSFVLALTLILSVVFVGTTPVNALVSTTVNDNDQLDAAIDEVYAKNLDEIILGADVTASKTIYPMKDFL